MDANLTFRSLSENYNYLANFSVYFVENGTFFKEVALQSDNGKVVKENLSQVSVFNRSAPIRIGILFQPVVNSYTEIPGNSFYVIQIVRQNPCISFCFLKLACKNCCS